MPENSRMHVLVSVDDTYAMQLSVMLTSLFATNEPCEITVWLLRRGLSAECCDTLASLVEGRGGRIELMEVDGSFFDGFPTASYITHETYLRLLSAEVLPKSLHRVLWLDADLIVRKSLEGLYNTAFSGNALVACAHGSGMPESMVAHCKDLGLDADWYINAGVLLINLDAWRSLDMRAEIRRVVASGAVLKYADQDLVNIIFKGRIGYVDGEVYNFRTNRELSSEDLQSARETAAIIHYCGMLKPWRLSDVALGDLWREAYAESPYGSRKLNLISSVALSRFVGKTKGLVRR